MSYTIGIDLGTTNTKAIALSETEEVLYEYSLPTRVNSVPTGGEIDPKRLQKDLLQLLHEVIQEIRKISDEPLTAIGITGMAEAGCIVDPEGEPLTPILLWYDRRGAAEAEELRPYYEALLTSVSGIRMSNVATIYKLCYLKKQHPSLTAHSNRWFGVPEWAAWTLTRQHWTEPTLAVRTGAYALKTNDWSPEVLNITGLDQALFPKILSVKDQVFHVSSAIADSLEIPDRVRVVVAGHDDMAAAYGAGLAPGIWVDSTGTAEGLIAPVTPCPNPEQTVHNRMSIAPAYHPQFWALIAGIGTSGSLLNELRKQTGLDFPQIDESAKVPAVYPEGSLTAELTPARLAKISFIKGLTNEQKIAAVYDIILENFSQRIQQITQFTNAPEKLVITGGHALLPELSRRKSEILGNIPTEARPKPEAAAYGAARLASKPPH